MLDHLDALLAENDIFTLNTLLQYWDGFTVTVQLTFISVVVGLFLAIPLALMRSSGNPWLSRPVWVFTYVFRGTPLLIQLYIIYYGVVFIPGIRESVFWPLAREALYPALLAFTLNTAAYTTEILRGAINATPRGEIEAARAYGMSWFQRTRRIVLPSAFRRAIQAYSNEVIFMLHATAIASVVTIVDLTGAARNIYSRFYSPFEAFIFVGLIYMVMTFTLVLLFRWLERRLLAHQRPVKSR